MHGNSDISHIRNYLKNNLLYVESFTGYVEERKQVFNLLERTVNSGESNSALLIGPRGVGKTQLVKDVMKELQNTESFSSNAMLVKLHGLLHTDDRLALKSTTTQMNLDNSVDGKVFGSFAENLAFLLACLKSGEKHTSKSVIFILEEFDLFCMHHNQTLLYNLFDVSQSAQTPLCILGITCRLDVIELLEKRVKSRFSHRQIFLFPKSSENDLEEHLNIIVGFLSLPETSKLNLPLSVQKQWNESIRSLCDDQKLINLVHRLQETDINFKTLKNFLYMLITSLNENKAQITFGDFEKQLDLLEADEMVGVLQDLNVLELCLIIAMKHHSEIYDNQAMNFEMVLTRYLKFVNANSSIQSVQRPVIMKAFEHIKNMELISMVSSAPGRTQKEYQMFKLLVTPKQIMDAVKKASGLPTEVEQWASSSLA